MSPLQDVCGTGLCRAQPALLLLPGDGGSTSHGHKLPCSPGSILHHWCMAAVMEPWEAVAVLPRCSLQEWHRCAPGTPVLTEFVPKALRSRLFWIAAGAGSLAVPAWPPALPQLLARHGTQLHPAPGQQPQDSGDVAHPAWWASWAAHSPLPAMQEGEQGHSGNHPQSGSSMEQMAEQTVLGFLFHIIFCPVHSHA